MPVVRNCKICGKKFNAKLSWIENGQGLYCSNACSFTSRRKGKLMACYICGKETYKTQKQLKNSKSKLFFCSKSCQTKWRNQVFIGPKHANWIHGRASYQSVLARHKTPSVCNICKIKDKRVLATHHVDQNRLNNKVENLVYLCHNCHHLVHHYTDVKKVLMKALGK